MARKRNWYWYCPEWGGNAVDPNPLSGVMNVGSNIVIELVNTDFAAPGDPRQDNFVVERIVGQYLLTAIATAEGGDRFVHHRVYQADGDQTSVALRELNTQDDADTSFLWHKVDGWSQSRNGVAWGGWAHPGGLNEAQVPFEHGRSGHFDIKVGRRIEEGQSLLWHTQLDAAATPPNDNEFGLFLWVRLLMREG